MFKTQLTFPQKIKKKYGRLKKNKNNNNNNNNNNRDTFRIN